VVASTSSPRMVAGGRRGEAVQSSRGDRDTLPLPSESHPLALDGDNDDAGDVAHRHERVESRMRGNAHVRFGGRAGETEWRKRRHRAPDPTQLHRHWQELDRGASRHPPHPRGEWVPHGNRAGWRTVWFPMSAYHPLRKSSVVFYRGGGSWSAPLPGSVRTGVSVETTSGCAPPAWHSSTRRWAA
jgi:hypothetical protein